MNVRSFFKSAAIGAGLCIFAIGLALAQTAPTPTPAPTAPQAAPAPSVPAPAVQPPIVQTPAVPAPDRRAMRDECRTKVEAMPRGERREAMRDCMREKREAAGGPGTREARRAGRERMRDIRKSCREELKDQRFTEAERKTALQECAAKKDPRLGKMLGCRKEAEDKKLERGSGDFRKFMRECNTRS